MEEHSLYSDEYDSFRSCGSRAADFQSAVSSGELGPQRNVGEETRTKITQQDFKHGGIIVSVARVCYGSYNGKKAVLLVIQLLLRGPKVPIRDLEISVSFAARRNKLGKRLDDAPCPLVHNLSPRLVSGIRNPNSQSWSMHVEQQCSATKTPPVTASSVSNGAQAVPQGPHTLFINGRPWSNKRQQKNHMACWTIRDKSERPIGIPDEIRLGVVVEYADKFQADVKLTLSDLSWRQKLNAFPWSVDDPILFPLREPGPSIGEEVSTRQFEALSDAEWAMVVSNHEVSRECVHDLGTTAALSQHKKNNVPRRNPKAFRLRGLPAESQALAVIKLVREFFGRDDPALDIELRSLAVDAGNDDRCVAVLTSHNLEAILGPGNQWKRNLSKVTDEAVQPRRPQWVTLDTHFDSLTPLATPERGGKHLLDIVALSGLGGHAYGSFKERGGEHMWLLDELPRDLPYSRILTYGYDTVLAESRSIQDIGAVASSFRTTLMMARPYPVDGQPKDKPIIFIAHSLGGIVLKQALIQLANGNARERSYLQAIRGILFFGVPSQGMDIESLIPMVKGKVNENFLQGLRRDSDMLRSQQLQFCKSFPQRRCKIISFFETEVSPTAEKGPDGWRMTGDPTLLVGPSSATLGGRAWEVGDAYAYPIKSSHSDMVKFHPGDRWYNTVTHVLKQLTKHIEV